MHDTTEVVISARHGYVTRHCKADYHRATPLVEVLNPLRYEIGIGRRRPCRIVWNRDGMLHVKWANFWWPVLRTLRSRSVK
jgi:hypothetical protein